jgi:ubiquinone/menaquinone biosynthesis C-methylase UbiE
MEEEGIRTNSYVFDAESSSEMGRLIDQDQVVTRAMGGSLTGIPKVGRLKNILDLGCGPGGWVLDVAFTLPEAEVEGVDVSRVMVDYANARARTQLLPNASFGVMDITQPLEFPDHSFDLVNARFLTAVLKRDAWFLFLEECHRVLRPGGILRLTEAKDFGATTCSWLNQFLALTRQALYQIGYGFTSDDGLNLIPILLAFYHQQHYKAVGVKATVLDFSVDTEGWAGMYRNIDIIAQQMKPVLLELKLISSELFDLMHQQSLVAMQLPTFCGLSHITTITGQKPVE